MRAQAQGRYLGWGLVALTGFLSLVIGIWQAIGPGWALAINGVALLFLGALGVAGSQESRSR